MFTFSRATKMAFSLSGVRIVSPGAGAIFRAHRELGAHAVRQALLLANARHEARLESRAAAQDVVGYEQRGIVGIVVDYIHVLARHEDGVLLVRRADRQSRRRRDLPSPPRARSPRRTTGPPSGECAS